MIEAQPAVQVSEKQAQKFDFSSIDPAKDFMCFGTIEPANQECIDCPYKTQCAAKAGITL